MFVYQVERYCNDVKLNKLYLFIYYLFIYFIYYYYYFIYLLLYLFIYYYIYLFIIIIILFIYYYIYLFINCKRLPNVWHKSQHTQQRHLPNQEDRNESHRAPINVCSDSCQSYKSCYS